MRLTEVCAEMVQQAVSFPVGGAQWLSISGLAGALDLPSLPTLRSLLSDAVSQRPAGVVLDFSDVTFMDCSALGPLLEARASLGGRLRLTGVDRRVRRVLEATYLDEVLVAPEGQWI